MCTSSYIHLFMKYSFAPYNTVIIIIVIIIIGCVLGWVFLWPPLLLHLLSFTPPHLHTSTLSYLGEDDDLLPGAEHHAVHRLVVQPPVQPRVVVEREGRREGRGGGGGEES